jgi:ribosomal protein S18 acetylase RimI-like enzyme
MVLEKDTTGKQIQRPYKIKSEISEKASNPDSLQIRLARVSDASVIAKLIADEIDWGHLRDLGHSFLKLLHRHMIVSESSVCFVAEQRKEIVGYMTGTMDTSKFYREFILRYGIIAAIILLPKVLRPRHFRTIVRGLTYFPEAYPEDPKAEMLAFAVRPETRQSGVGKALFNATINEFKMRDVRAIKFGTVSVTNKAANAFYRRIGCRLVRTIPFYKDTEINVYIYQII